MTSCLYIKLWFKEGKFVIVVFKGLYYLYGLCNVL